MYQLLQPLLWSKAVRPSPANGVRVPEPLMGLASASRAPPPPRPCCLSAPTSNLAGMCVRRVACFPSRPALLRAFLALLPRSKLPGATRDSALPGSSTRRVTFLWFCAWCHCLMCTAGAGGDALSRTVCPRAARLRRFPRVTKAIGATRDWPTASLGHVFALCPDGFSPSGHALRYGTERREHS